MCGVYWCITEQSKGGSIYLILFIKKINSDKCTQTSKT